MAVPLAVYSFPEYASQAQSLAAALDAPCLAVTVHRFPDGESCVRLPADTAEHAVLCRSLHDPDHKLIELLLAIATLRERGARRVTLVAPYLCYMRQDMAFRDGEAVSQRIIGHILAQQLDALVTVDPHLHRIASLKEAVPIRHPIAVSATSAIAAYLAQQCVDALLVGPDGESEQWVQAIARATGFDYVIGSKERNGDRNVAIQLPKRVYDKRDVVLVDDMASTGRTLATAARQLKQAGARRLFAAVTHALFVDDALEHIVDAGIDTVWSTDSIPHATNVIALAPLLAQEVRQLEF